MFERLISLLLLCCVLPPGVTLGEPKTAHKVFVQVLGCSPSEASIVINGLDHDAIELIAKGGGWWWNDTALGFDLENVKASLRLHPGRTPCRPVFTDEEDENGKPIAVFTFRCTKRDDHHRHVQLELEPSISFAYLRVVGRNPVDPESVACEERGAILEKGEITDIDRRYEKVFVYLGETTPLAEPDIVISDILTPGTLSLGNLHYQRTGGGNARANPAFSAPWLLREKANLAKRGIHRVKVTVRK